MAITPPSIKSVNPASTLNPRIMEKRDYAILDAICRPQKKHGKRATTWLTHIHRFSAKNGVSEGIKDAGRHRRSLVGAGVIT
ncbi:hypothetical protein KKF34_05625 [Myxococcota bacterium]|nr:hypothetical protein [Myxococcota bacterium]